MKKSDSSAVLKLKVLAEEKEEIRRKLITDTMTGVVNTTTARLSSSDKTQSVALEIDFMKLI